jgi:hypothetical protein
MTIEDAKANVGKRILSNIPIRPPNGGGLMLRGTEFTLKEVREGPPLKFKVAHASDQFGDFEMEAGSEELDWFVINQRAGR